MPSPRPVRSPNASRMGDLSWAPPGSHAGLITGRLLALALLFGLAASLDGQEPPDTLSADVSQMRTSQWNSPEVRELISRARAMRQAVVVDDSMRSYQADARGYVYFFLDRAGSEETNLVKTDQIALEVYWKAPDSTRQRIVGLRDEASLPTNINYHLDHLTVVQDDYADLIRLGDGDEVAAVIHPVAPGSDRVYEFRIADSLMISFPGPREPVRVYEIEVRPRDFTRPGFVGTVFIDVATAAIVRMNFSFTPASYVDDYLDYIRISLDNSLWDGRFWLPYEQRVELRREVPWFDFPAGTVIRGRWEIRNYRFNEPLPGFLFQQRSVTALPEEQRRSFPFGEDLHAQVDEEGLGPVPELDEVRAQAARIAGEQLLGGLARNRPWVPNASFGFRHNRAEGTALGLGWAWRPRDDLRLAGAGGWAFGADHAYGTLRVSRSVGWNLSATGYLRAPTDLNPGPVVAGATNTVAGLIGERDYTDLHFRSGAQITASPPGTGITGRLFAERHRNPNAARFGRSTLAIDEGRQFGVGLDASRSWALGGSALPLTGEVRAQVAHFQPVGLDAGDYTYGTLDAALGWTAQSLVNQVEGRVRLEGGWTSAAAPTQTLTLLGGRGTLLGYEFRAFAGDRWARFHVEGFHLLDTPWLSLGAFGSVGATWLRPGSAPTSWDVRTTGLARWSAGFSARWFWDILRTDLGRGLNGGGWEFQASVHPRFWDWM